MRIFFHEGCRSSSCATAKGYEYDQISQTSKYISYKYYSTLTTHQLLGTLLGLIGADYPLIVSTGDLMITHPHIFTTQYIVLHAEPCADFLEHTLRYLRCMQALCVLSPCIIMYMLTTISLYYFNIFSLCGSTVRLSSAT